MNAEEVDYSTIRIKNKITTKQTTLSGINAETRRIQHTKRTIKRRIPYQKRQHKR